MTLGFSLLCYNMAWLIPPGDLRMDGNMEEDWPLFKQRFQLYLKATGAVHRPSDQLVALFLTVAGPKALELYNSFQLDAKEEDDFEAVLARFEHHFTPHRNETYKRFLFRTRLQELRESLDGFVADLQLKSRLCNFGDQRESLVRDQLVLGCRDNHARQQLLLQKDELTFEDAVRICRLAEEREEARCAEGIRGHPEQSEDEKEAPLQVGDAKASKGQALRKKRRVRSTGHRTSDRQRQWENCPRKESIRTYV